MIHQLFADKSTDTFDFLLEAMNRGNGVEFSEKRANEFFVCGKVAPTILEPQIKKKKNSHSKRLKGHLISRQIDGSLINFFRLFRAKRKFCDLIGSLS